MSYKKKKLNEAIPSEYIQRIKKKNKIRYILGFLIRFKKHLINTSICCYARFKGASIGMNVVMPYSLAKKANRNLVIGNDIIIETSDIDLRSKVVIKDHCIINKGVSIIRVSHYVDNSPEYRTKYYDDLVICSYSWLATSCVILPSVTRIETGSIIGASSVLVRNSNEDGVYSGNPAKELRKHEGRFDKLVVCSLKGGDYNYYKCVYKL